MALHLRSRARRGLPRPLLAPSAVLQQLQLDQFYLLAASLAALLSVPWPRLTTLSLQGRITPSGDHIRTGHAWHEAASAGMSLDFMGNNRYPAALGLRVVGTLAA